MLSSVVPEIAEARGIRGHRIEICFLIVLALATAMTVPVIGALLIFSLMIGPPAAARSLTSRPALAMALSVAIALITVWAAIAASYLYNWPIGFFVGALAAISYGAGRGWACMAPHPPRRRNPSPGGHRPRLTAACPGRHDIGGGRSRGCPPYHRHSFGHVQRGGRGHGDRPEGAHRSAGAHR